MVERIGQQGSQAQCTSSTHHRVISTCFGQREMDSTQQLHHHRSNAAFRFCALEQDKHVSVARTVH